MNAAVLAARLTQEEGLRPKPYTDTVGKLTIGVGRNLTDRGLSKAEVDFLLANDIALVIEELNQRCAWWTLLDEARQIVIADMAFNLGVPKFLLFKRVIAAVIDGDFESASVYMLQSKWAEQVGSRATALAEIMRTGEYVAL